MIIEREEATKLHIYAHELTCRIDMLDLGNVIERKESNRLVCELEDIVRKLEAHYDTLESNNKQMVEAKTTKLRLT